MARHATNRSKPWKHCRNHRELFIARCKNRNRDLFVKLLDYVKKGDMVIPAWNAIIKTMNALRILPGKGIYLTQTKDGTIISTKLAANNFKGAWSCSIAGNEVIVQNGYVNGETITEKKEPVKETRLPLPKTKESRQWVCIVSKVDPEKGTWIKESLSLEIRDSPLYTETGSTTFFAPIAIINRSEKEPKLRQIAFFDYRFITARKQRGSGYYGFYHVA